MVKFFLTLSLFVSCTMSPEFIRELPEEDIEFISYVYAKTSQGEWQSCQKFMQHFPSLEKVGFSETIDCLDTMICQDPESRSKLMEYVHRQTDDDIYVEYISFVFYEVEEGLVRTCQKFIQQFPKIENVGFSEVIQCLDLMVCQSEEARAQFIDYFHRYLQAL